MNRSGHPDRELNALKVRTLKTPGRHADGNGLYLVVDPSGARRWILRTVVLGRRRDIGLGSAKLVSLASARDAAREYRDIARRGGDPIALRRAKKGAPTFMQAARSVHDEHSHAWKNDKHRAQWLTTLTRYAYPLIGDLRINEIESPDILRILAPIWITKAVTARRLHQRLRTVFDWAKASGHRAGDNPVDGVEKGLPRRQDRVSHRAAMPYASVPAFITDLQNCELSEPSRLAFEFLILTATRTNEVLRCRWEEIDLNNKVWTIPESRMKGGREHRVPLTPRCLEILTRASEIAGKSGFVFPGRKADSPLTNMVFLMALRRMGLTVTAHGFRSAFRDWAAERTNFPREVCEMALAHSIRDKVEAAYRRGDLFEKRRQLMNAWSGFAGARTADVISLRRQS